MKLEFKGGGMKINWIKLRMELEKYLPRMITNKEFTVGQIIQIIKENINN